MLLGDSIRNGASWLFFGNTGNLILQFIFGVILARLLVPADFGMIVTISVFTGIASLVSSGGMGQSIIRAKEVDERDFTAVFTLQLAFGMLWYTIFFISSPYIADYFRDPLYTDLMRVSTLVFLLKPFTSMRNVWLNREMEYKKRALVGGFSGIVTGASSIIMAWQGMGVWSLTLSGLLGALCTNILLGLVTPLKLSLSPNITLMKKHSSYGIKTTALDIISHLCREGQNLIISKMAGPGFLGLFNKADSQAKLPNRIIMPAAMQPVFRAMSKVQDDLDQTKYLFYRSITLITVFTSPLYIGLWWVAEPFIFILYGEKWVPSVEPLRILLVAGFFFNIQYPCGVLLGAQNKLTQEIYVQLLRLVFVVIACLVGIKWGLKGIAIAMVATYAFTALSLYSLVRKTISTKVADLTKAMWPGIFLGTILFAMLSMINYGLVSLKISSPLAYLLTMAFSGGITYALAFLLVPIRSLNSEVERWRKIIKPFYKPIGYSIYLMLSLILLYNLVKINYNDFILVIKQTIHIIDMNTPFLIKK